jgi:hypothetical protein
VLNRAYSARSVITSRPQTSIKDADSFPLRANEEHPPTDTPKQGRILFHARFIPFSIDPDADMEGCSAVPLARPVQMCQPQRLHISVSIPSSYSYYQEPAIAFSQLASQCDTSTHRHDPATARSWPQTIPVFTTNTRVTALTLRTFAAWLCLPCFMI